MNDPLFWAIYAAILIIGFGVMPLLIERHLRRKEQKRIENYMRMTIAEKKAYWAKSGVRTNDDGEPI